MFKKLRSLIGRLFNENQQMLIVLYLSDFFWFLRKYFLSVEIEYPSEFLRNWSTIRRNSSQDKERNFTVYQMIKVHNEVFKGKKTNLIEFGVDRGGTLTTISCASLTLKMTLLSQYPFVFITHTSIDD